jgi:hypothetical protein
MKRVTQILASFLFIITVLTVYLAFDFTVNTIVPKKSLTDKHEHIHSIQRTSTISSVLKTETLSNNQERRTRNVKNKQSHGKPAQFHKSKTGVKINQMKKVAKEQRKHFLTTKITQTKSS